MWPCWQVMQVVAASGNGGCSSCATHRGDVLEVEVHAALWQPVGGAAQRLMQPRGRCEQHCVLPPLQRNAARRSCSAPWGSGGGCGGGGEARQVPTEAVNSSSWRSSTKQLFTCRAMSEGRHMLGQERHEARFPGAWRQQGAGWGAGGLRSHLVGGVQAVGVAHDSDAPLAVRGDAQDGLVRGLGAPGNGRSATTRKRHSAHAHIHTHHQRPRLSGLLSTVSLWMRGCG